VLLSCRRAGAALVLLASALASAPGTAQTALPSSGPVTVVVEVVLAANTSAPEALVALNQMRVLMKRQPGYMSEAFLQNLNPGNAPRFVHVSRWASMAYWAALFRAPEFTAFSAHGNEHFSIAVGAFLPVE
jgi:heme-degrading monooxygenase HmoA